MVCLGTFHYSLWEMPVRGRTVTRNLNMYLASLSCILPSTSLPMIGGSSANSILSPSHCTDHPLRARSSFLHPLTVFSTLLLGGSIVAFGFTISVVLLTLVWVICSYSIYLIQPYPRPSPPVKYQLIRV